MELNMFFGTFMALLGMLLRPGGSQRRGLVVWGFTCF